MVYAPSFVEGGKNISLDDLVTHVAEVAEELMIMSFAVRKALSLIVTIPQEWFFAFSANKVFYMPVFSQGSYNALFDWTAARTTYGYSHFVVAP
jgi:hypothetical protein